MKILVRVGMLCVAISAAAAQAGVPQEPDTSTSSASAERVRVALRSTPSIADRGLFAPPPERMRFGALTFVPSETPGQFVSVRVPIGAFGSRATHALTVARHRRAEDAARREVAQVVADLQNARAK